MAYNWIYCIYVASKSVNVDTTIYLEFGYGRGIILCPLNKLEEFIDRQASHVIPKALETKPSIALCEVETGDWKA
jgi:hypothetical protein